MNTPHAHIEQTYLVASPTLTDELAYYESDYHRRALRFNEDHMRKRSSDPYGGDSSIVEKPMDSSVAAFYLGLRPNMRIPSAVIKGSPSAMREASSKNESSPFKAVTMAFSKLVGSAADTLSRFVNGSQVAMSEYRAHAPQLPMEPDVLREYGNRIPAVNVKTTHLVVGTEDTPWRAQHRRAREGEEMKFVLLGLSLAALLLFPVL